MVARLFRALVELTPNDVHIIDSTTAKAHRSAAGEKGGPRAKRSVTRAGVARQKSTPSPMARPAYRNRNNGRPALDIRAALPLLTALPAGRLCAGNAAYDSDCLRRFLTERETMPVSGTAGAVRKKILLDLLAAELFSALNLKLQTCPRPSTLTT